MSQSTLTTPLESSQLAPRIIAGASTPPPARREHGVAHAATYVAIGYVAGQVVRLVSNIVLSRLLFPAAFGTMALVATILQGLEMFSDCGVAASIVQDPRGEDPAFLDTAFTIQVVRGVVLWIGSTILAWPLAWFYDRPELQWVVPLASLIVILGGLNSTSLYTVRRNLRLKSLTILELAVQVLGCFVNCVWAWISPGLMALVGGSLIAALLRTVASHLVLGGHPNRFRWDPTAAKTLFHFGKWIFLGSLITFLAMQSDRLVLGTLVAPELFGVYNVAWALAVMPLVMLDRFCASLLHPVLAKSKRGSAKEMVEKLYTARDALLNFSVIVIFAVFVESDLLFRLLYDSRYQLAAPLAQVLCLATWVAILSATLTPALLSLGDSRGPMLAGLIRFVATISLTITGYHFGGIWGFVVGLTVGSICGHAALLVFLRKHEIAIVGQDIAYSTVLTTVMGLAALSHLAGPVAGAVFPQLALVGITIWSGNKLWRRYHQDPQSMPEVCPAVPGEIEL